MKKVTLKHLSGKHDISIKELRGLLVSQGLISQKDNKVFKKPAKKIIREHQAQLSGGIYSGPTRFESIYAWIMGESWRYTMLGGIALLGLIGGFSSIYQAYSARGQLYDAASIVETTPQAWIGNPGDTILPETDPRKNILENSHNTAVEEDYPVPNLGPSIPEILPETGYGCDS